MAAGLAQGVVFRAINKAGRMWGDGMSPKVLWGVVRAAAARANIDKLAPHDLRRTCARQPESFRSTFVDASFVNASKEGATARCKAGTWA